MCSFRATPSGGWWWIRWLCRHSARGVLLRTAVYTVHARSASAIKVHSGSVLNWGREAWDRSPVLGVLEPLNLSATGRGLDFTKFIFIICWPAGAVAGVKRPLECKMHSVQSALNGACNFVGRTYVPRMYPLNLGTPLI